MLDLLIRGALVVDGTGAPGRQVDVGVRDGRIAVLGPTDEPAAEVVDAGGLVLTPGFVDPHTHYDAQLFWDPSASPSNLHGVTTVIGGNCGFTLAPVRSDDVAYTQQMMAKVEGMPLAALEQGLPWDWSSFGDYLSRLDGRTAVNAGFLVGHCALRRWVMGAASVGEVASAEQVAAMQQALAESLDAGGLGFSSSQSFTHSDMAGDPVPSRWATRDETLAMCEVVRDHPGTTLEFIIDGCLDRFSDAEIDLMVAMTTTAQRPLNWNVMTIGSDDPTRHLRQLEASRRAEEAGGRIVALTMPTLVGMNMSFLTFCALFQLPGWQDVLTLPVPERMAELRDPDVRRVMDERSHTPEAGVFRRLASWGRYIVGDTFSSANEGLSGRTVRDIATERGVSDFDALVDVVLADDLRTILWPGPSDSDDDSWQLRREAWAQPYAMLGGSDAGAHLDRMLGSNYTTEFLADVLRGKQLTTLEDAVRHLTDVPARLFGLKDRGRVAEGGHADLVLFDPDTVGSEPIRKVADLPGAASRLYAGSEGVVRVLVNGTTIVRDSTATGALPGTLLRSGRDTETVLTPGAR
jgi:N-acyl-D-aspartate/D-glutamate deacylase